MSLLGRTRSLLLFASVLIGVTVWVSGNYQRHTADRARTASLRADVSDRTAQRELDATANAAAAWQGTARDVIAGVRERGA
ncbi:MAG: hypothetical protein JWM73_187, partial [Solirubrobacterales bacterium]|nr:hypothetical protein [Solirubrobacterales bacterium]